MSGNKIVLEAAQFLDSVPQLPVPRDAAQEIVQRFLRGCYEDLGKAPRFLEGEDLAVLLRSCLPAKFGRREPLAAAVPAVLSVFLEYLSDRYVVAHGFELNQVLETDAELFQAAVERGVAQDQGPAPTIVERAPKVGRNDPCPCGSGKKFKKCCARL